MPVDLRAVHGAREAGGRAAHPDAQRGRLSPDRPQARPGAGRIGVGAALAAYIFWGLAPIYFKQIPDVPALEIIAHRIVWAIPLLAGFLLLRDRGKFLQRVRLPLRTVAVLGGCGLLVATNWLIFVWAVVNDQVLATSLGYFIGPLVNFLLGFLFLKERLTRIQGIGVVIAAAGTLYLGWFLGAPPWISLGLAFSFGFYGLIRKMLPVGPMVGLLWETLMLAPLAVGFVAWSWQRGRLVFGGGDVGTDLLLLLAGLVTVLPLFWFNKAARTLDLSTLGFFQYIAPSMTFLLSVFIYGEAFTQGHAVAFGCIWFALAMVTVESVKRHRQLPVGEAQG
ncbi:MAG: EamA family transporter RarD [Xanthomonadales bacterium]|nr:EamA family transporter RarD [Xanthomonadales bacterium]